MKKRKNLVNKILKGDDELSVSVAIEPYHCLYNMREGVTEDENMKKSKQSYWFLGMGFGTLSEQTKHVLAARKKVLL